MRETLGRINKYKSQIEEYFKVLKDISIAL
jgi:hypothetical protein